MSDNVRKRNSGPVRPTKTLRSPHEEKLAPWLFTMHPVKILVRLSEFAG